MRARAWAWVGIIVLVYLLFPFKSTIDVRNTLGAPQRAYVTVLGLGWIPLYGKETSFATLYLPKGFYTVRIDRFGFEPVRDALVLPPNLMPRVDARAYVLQERRLPLGQWSFEDPTGTLALDPSLHVTGKDVRGADVDTVARRGDNVTYGWYDVQARDPNFEGSFLLDGDTLKDRGQQFASARLRPRADGFFEISGEEESFVENFLQGYLDLSARGIIEERMRGYPREYAIASRGRTVSLGDMAFLVCEARAFGSPQGSYFVPLAKTYALSGDAHDARDCYAHALSGEIPATVRGAPLASLLANATAATAAQPALAGELNAKERRGEIAFTFDIESGRYVSASNKGPDALSPCASSTLGEGIAPGDAAQCANASSIAWFSAADGEPSPEAIPYPWSSGARGYREILDLSTRTGIPTTQFVVTRDLGVLSAYDPSLHEDLARMSAGGLVEIALHSRYHSDLGVADPEAAREELVEGKRQLEREFNATVRGYRAPYLSVLDGDQGLYERTLIAANFTYYSHDLGVRGALLRHKAYTMYYVGDRSVDEMEGDARVYGYVMTLDHPWNFYYTEEQAGGTWRLRYNASRADLTRSRIYEAIADGLFPVTGAQLDAGEGG